MWCELSTPGFLNIYSPSLHQSPLPLYPYTLLSPMLYLSSLGLPTPALAQSSAKLSGGVGQKRIFSPHSPQQMMTNFTRCTLFVKWRSIQSERNIFTFSTTNSRYTLLLTAAVRSLPYWVRDSNSFDLQYHLSTVQQELNHHNHHLLEWYECAWICDQNWSNVRAEACIEYN